MNIAISRIIFFTLGLVSLLVSIFGLLVEFLRFIYLQHIEFFFYFSFYFAGLVISFLFFLRFRHGRS